MNSKVHDGSHKVNKKPVVNNVCRHYEGNQQVADKCRN